MDLALSLMTDVESGARGAGNRPVSVCLVTLVVYNQLRHGALTYSYFILHGCGSYVTEGHAELRAGTTYPRSGVRAVPYAPLGRTRAGGLLRPGADLQYVSVKRSLLMPCPR